MAKTYTKGAKRRAKKSMANMPKLSSTPKREKNGRVSRAGVDRDPSGQVLGARCRHAGIAQTAKNKRDMRAPWNGCEAGRAMAASVRGEEARREFWDAIQHIRRVTADHDRAIGAPNRHAVCMRLLTPTEGMSADASTPPKDERTDAEKMRAATTAKMRVETWLGYTDKAARSDCLTSVLEDVPPKDITGFLSALSCVRDGKKGRRLTYLGRG